MNTLRHFLKGAGWLAFVASILALYQNGFHEFSSKSDLLLAGLPTLGVGLLEAGRLCEILRMGQAAGYSRAESPRMYRMSVAVLVAGVLVLIGGGGLLTLLPIL